MAPIKEFSSADLNTISRLSGVSNVLVKVNGATVAASSFSGLLDTYTGAAAAYSVRKLDKDYTGSCMRIVVDSAATVGTLDSSDPEFDIGFDTNGDLDTAEIVTRCNNPSGTNYNAYVTKWYDQSGNGNDAVQTTHANMPQIASTGAVITENGKPALDFDGAGDHFPLDVTANGLNLDVANTSSFHVGKYDDTTPAFILSLGGSSPSSNRWYPGYHNSTLRYGYGVYSAANSETGDTNQNLFTMIAGSTLGGAEAWRNGSSKMTAPLASSAIMGDSVGIGRFRTTFYLDGNVQEVLIYDSDQSTNRSGIEGNINSHFQIY